MATSQKNPNYGEGLAHSMTCEALHLLIAYPQRTEQAIFIESYIYYIMIYLNLARKPLLLSKA